MHVRMYVSKYVYMQPYVHVYIYNNYHDQSFAETSPTADAIDREAASDHISRPLLSVA